MKQLTDTLRRANKEQGDNMNDTIVTITNDLQSGRHEPQYTFAQLTQWFAIKGETQADYAVSPILKGKPESRLLQRDHGCWLDSRIRDELMAQEVETRSELDIPSWWPKDCLAVMSPRAMIIVQQCPVAQRSWMYNYQDAMPMHGYIGTWNGVKMHTAPTMADAEILFLEDGALIYGGLSSVRAAYLGEEDGEPLFVWMSKELVQVVRYKVRRVRLA